MKSKLMQAYSEIVTVEEFIEAGAETVLANTNTEIPVLPYVEFGEPQEDMLGEIEQAVVVADQLDELAGDVDNVTHINGMESYSRIYNQMVSNLGLSLPTQVSVEDFPMTRGGKRSLAKTIKNHAKHLRSVAALGMEDYLDHVDEELDQYSTEYKGAVKVLDRIKPELDIPHKALRIDHKAIWKMFHHAARMIDSPEAIKDEDADLRAFGKILSTAVTRFIADSKDGTVPKDLFSSKSEWLLFNRRLVVKGNKVECEDYPVKNPEREYTLKDCAWVVGWGIVFPIIGGLIASKVMDGSGEEKTVGWQGKRGMMMFIDTVKRMGSIVQDVERDIDKLKKYLDSAKENQSELKAAASPILKLAVVLVRQVKDLAQGSAKLFDEINKAE